MEAKFCRILKLLGDQFRARAEDNGRRLWLRLSQSHDVEVTVPPAVRVFIFKPNKIVCVGIDKERTHQFASSVRNIKPANIYTGEGLRYAHIDMKLKPGKNGIIKKLID